MSHNGSNIASVLGRLAVRSPGVKRRIEEYLGKVVPGVTQVDRKAVGPRETLQFRQRVGSAEHPWRFYASSMSDGTLRACGVLVSLFQGVGGSHLERSLVGIEEPEIALHPAAAGVLVDGLCDAAQHVQILVTSHSADLLDSNDIPDESILTVTAEHGESRIGPLDEVGRSVLKDRLYTAGELLKDESVGPRPGALPVALGPNRPIRLKSRGLRKIATIVEGHGEVDAVPILLRRIAASLGSVVHTPRPIRVSRDKVVKPGELERAVELAARQAATGGCILILLDAEKDCPKDLAPKLLRRAMGARSDREIRVVLAKTEYEAWFLAAASSIAGRRRIRPSATPPDIQSRSGVPRRG